MRTSEWLPAATPFLIALIIQAVRPLSDTLVENTWKMMIPEDMEIHGRIKELTLNAMRHFLAQETFLSSILISQATCIAWTVRLEGQWASWIAWSAALVLILGLVLWHYRWHTLSCSQETLGARQKEMSVFGLAVPIVTMVATLAATAYAPSLQSSGKDCLKTAAEARTSPVAQLPEKANTCEGMPPPQEAMAP